MPPLICISSWFCWSGLEWTLEGRDVLSGAWHTTAHEQGTQPHSRPGSGSSLHVNINSKSSQAFFFFFFTFFCFFGVMNLNSMYRHCICCWLFVDPVVEKATQAKIHCSAAIFSGSLWADMSSAWSCILLLTLECIHCCLSASSEIADHWSVARCTEPQSLHGDQLCLECLRLSLFSLYTFVEPCERCHILDQSSSPPSPRRFLVCLLVLLHYNDTNFSASCSCCCLWMYLRMNVLDLSRYGSYRRNQQL